MIPQRDLSRIANDDRLKIGSFRECAPRCLSAD